jgi:hypothetical protein
MRRLGAKSITALVVADREVAWQILALNTEKAHNLKERSLEVIRIYRGLVDEDATRPESQFAFYLDEPALVTLGVCYERFPRFGGSSRQFQTPKRCASRSSIDVRHDDQFENSDMRELNVIFLNLARGVRWAEIPLLAHNFSK